MNTNDMLDFACASESARLYAIRERIGNVDAFVATSPGTRAICNDPRVYGLDYTARLRASCADILRVFQNLFPERYQYGDAKHSYLIELKFSAKDAPEAELAAKCQDALAQLARYRADKSVPTLARGTTLHQIVFQFKGTELVRCEQVAEEEMQETT